MCNNKVYFKNIVQDKTPILVGSGQIIYSQGRGSIGPLHDVYYVPDLTSNLLSISYLNKLGLSITFDANGKVYAADNNVYGTKTYIGKESKGVFYSGSNLYSIVSKANGNLALSSIATRSQSPYILLHNRFAHINDYYIDITLKLHLVRGLKKLKRKMFKSPPCESCILAKATRISSTKTPGSRLQLKNLKFMTLRTSLTNKYHGRELPNDHFNDQSVHNNFIVILQSEYHPTLNSLRTSKVHFSYQAHLQRASNTHCYSLVWSLVKDMLCSYDRKVKLYVIQKI